jgi:hypothetical protein
MLGDVLKPESASGIKEKQAGIALMRGLLIFAQAAALLLGTPFKAAAIPELFAAIKAGGCSTVRSLVQLDPKMLESRSVRGSRPLHCAAAQGEVLIV